MLTALPYLVLEALRTAVEVVRAAVYRKSVLLALKGFFFDSKNQPSFEKM